MTTTEKRGFRLPWGGDNRRPEDEPESGTAAAAVLAPATDLAPAIATSVGTARPGSMLRRNPVEELGRGPFDLETADESDVSGAAASLVDVVEPVGKPAADAATGAGDDMAGSPAAGTEAAGTEAAGTEAAPHAMAGSQPAAPAWPEVDRRGSARHLESNAPPPAIRPAVVVEGGARKVNPLVAGLVKAMRDAARAARDETTARMRSEAAARADQIRLEAVAAGAALKKRADEDVAGIREWSRTEMARIRQETETRIADRKAQLLRETQDHAAATERLNADLKSAIAAFESEMERFFELLLQEDDPARLATLAERLPEPPTFAHIGEGSTVVRPPRAARAAAVRKPATRRERPAARLEPDAAAAAEAEAILGLDEDTVQPPVADGADAELAAIEEAAPVAEEAAFADDMAAPAADDAAPALDAAMPLDAASTFDPAHGAERTPAFGAADGTAADLDPDTNGHVAPAETIDDADNLAAWTEALAAIRDRADGLDVAEPDAAPSAGAASAAADDEPDLGAFDASPDSLLGVLAGANRINSPDDLSPEERIALLGFDEPAPGEEPAPMTATPIEAPATESITRVVVAGLASVAEISAFKSALVGVAGVTSVSVTTGNDGDFVFSVVHATSTDLRAAVPAFARFAPQLTADEGAVLTYMVGEPGS